MDSYNKHAKPQQSLQLWLALISQQQMPGGTVSYYGTMATQRALLTSTSGAVTDTYTYDAYGT